MTLLYKTEVFQLLLYQLLCSASSQCRCHPGFHLKDDGKTCVDIDECTTTYPCTQRCINTHGSFRCLCVEGFSLSPENPTICKSTSGKKNERQATLSQEFKANPLTHVSLPADEEPFLIFANRYYLRKLNLDGSNYTLLKQVRPADTGCTFEVPGKSCEPPVVGGGGGIIAGSRLMQLLCFDRA